MKIAGTWYPHLEKILKSAENGLPRWQSQAVLALAVGVALGARVWHVITYRGSPEDSLIYGVFTKTGQKGVRARTA